MITGNDDDDNDTNESLESTATMLPQGQCGALDDAQQPLVLWCTANCRSRDLRVDSSRPIWGSQRLRSPSSSVNMAQSDDTQTSAASARSFPRTVHDNRPATTSTSLTNGHLQRQRQWHLNSINPIDRLDLTEHSWHTLCLAPTMLIFQTIISALWKVQKNCELSVNSCD